MGNGCGSIFERGYGPCCAGALRAQLPKGCLTHEDVFVELEETSPVFSPRQEATSSAALAPAQQPHNAWHPSKAHQGRPSQGSASSKKPQGACMDASSKPPPAAAQAQDPMTSEFVPNGCIISDLPGPSEEPRAKPSAPACTGPSRTSRDSDRSSGGGATGSATLGSRPWRTKTSRSSTSFSDEKSKKSSRLHSFSSSRWSKGGDPSSSAGARGSRGAEPRRTYANVNMPQDYQWLESALESIASNQAATLGCQDTATGQGFVPVFFVLGACPNIFCGMQAIMYSVNGEGEVDFWWVKPGKSNSAGSVGVEENTLSRHAKGPYKNDPGRSKPFYKPLADLFKQEQVVEGLRFGIEQGEPGKSSRAFLEQVSECGQATRQYMHLVWQEDWTSNPFSRSKYIKGKIVYQKDPQTLQFHSRQYHILNGSITVSKEEEAPFSSVIPGEEIKDLRD